MLQYAEMNDVYEKEFRIKCNDSHEGCGTATSSPRGRAVIFLNLSHKSMMIEWIAVPFFVEAARLTMLQPEWLVVVSAGAVSTD